MSTFSWADDVAARLERIRRDRGDIAFVLDNGCCGGTTLVVIEGRFAGPRDITLGEVAGVRVLCSPGVARTAQTDHFRVEVREGARSAGFSLAGLYDLEFTYSRQISKA